MQSLRCRLNFHSYRAHILMGVWWNNVDPQKLSGWMCTRCGKVKEQSIRELLAVSDSINAKHPKVRYEFHPNIWRSTP
jgi:hypothetical protein